MKQKLIISEIDIGSGGENFWFKLNDELLAKCYGNQFQNMLKHQIPLRTLLNAYLSTC